MVEAVFFYIFAALLLGLGLAVVIQKNPLGSAMALVGAFAVLAALYALLSAPLVAVLQVLVYAGGIMVLMVFVIMLVNMREDQLQALRLKPALLAASFAAAGMGLTLPIAFHLIRVTPAVSSTLPEGFGSLEATAVLLFGPSLFPFEMLSLVLLSALVGALVLVKKRL
jgi:NADH-quinone oxidoreductase subunit J